MYSQVFQPTLTSAAPLFWEMLYQGSAIPDKAKMILAVIWFFMPQGTSDALRWSSGELSLPSTWHQYTFVHPQFFFRWVQSGQLSEHHIQRGEEYYTREEMSNKQYRQTLARQRWCLPKKGDVYRQESWKSSNTSAQGMSLICWYIMQPLGLSGLTTTTGKHCSFPAVNEQVEPLPHRRNGAFCAYPCRHKTAALQCSLSDEYSWSCTQLPVFTPSGDSSISSATKDTCW